MDSFLNILLGKMDAWAFLAYMVIALLCAALRLARDAEKNRRRAIGTPYHFSWRVFLLDNLQKWLIITLSCAFCIRFSNEQFGTSITAIAAAGIGWGLGQFSIFTKRQQNKART